MADTVRAAVQIAPRNIEIREFPRPRIGPENGLLRVEANGICGSDVETFKGHLGAAIDPFIPGHEPLGIIEEVGERAAERWGVQPGDRVALEIIVPCRSCQRCLTGRYQSCRNRTVGHGVTPVKVAPGLWGGLSEYLFLSPNAILHPVDKTLPTELAVMFNPIGAGVRWACHLGGVGLGDTVLVLGAGQRGLASVIAARAAGAGTIIVTGLTRDAPKLALAQRFGADHVIDVEREDARRRVKDLTGGRGADVVVEVSANAPEPVAEALHYVAAGGRIVLAGVKGFKSVPDFVSDLVVMKEARILGAFGVTSPAYA